MSILVARKQVGLTWLFPLQYHTHDRHLGTATAKQALKRRKCELRNRDHFATTTLICCHHLKSKECCHLASEAALCFCRDSRLLTLVKQLRAGQDRELPIVGPCDTPATNRVEWRSQGPDNQAVQRIGTALYQNVEAAYRLLLSDTATTSTR